MESTEFYHESLTFYKSPPETSSKRFLIAILIKRHLNYINDRIVASFIVTIAIQQRQ